MLPEPQTDNARRQRAIELHAEIFGQAPASIAFAPGRVNLMGDHIDYNGGAVLPMAIDRGTTCAVSRRSDSRISVVSRQAGAVAVTTDLRPTSQHALGGWLSYVIGCAEVAASRGWCACGVNISVDGDVPLGAGLSSSASLECAILTALIGMGDSMPDPMVVALAGQVVEHEYAGVPCGIMDQVASMLAQQGSAILLDTLTSSIEQVPLGLRELGLSVLVIDTNAHHELSDGGYAARRASCEAAARLLGVAHLASIPVGDLKRTGSLPEPLASAARHVITENARVRLVADAFRAKDASMLGMIFRESHASLSDDFLVGCAELDVAVTAAIGAGAAAARMTGGGFGGSVVALCEPDRMKGICSKVDEAFGLQGLAAPSFMTTVPSRGARLLPSD